MQNFLKVCFKGGAGLAGLAAMLFLAVHKQWLTIDLLSMLTAKQVFVCFIVCMVFAFVLCMALLFMNYKDNQRKHALGTQVTASGKGSVAVHSSGTGNVTIHKGK
ncbi:TPA: hypothetical protein O8U20_001976 [Enterobacter cloacae]|uniref:hypothetical protein n=1 Tax=Enterobacter TaxID=547 RepID=UPI001BE06DBF|nr:MULTISPECIES: hypothetical protein [Enterobacter]MBT1841513.1 hypothetical protein [Enterobacter hormaechei subsp. xiangfangensis]HDC4600536.1 hypothetical protein [Enterobacter cloacae]MCK7154650.1 hypothetical protein [Enterobacter kobei]MDW3569965.1 hypothetical protein [Enterobacter asburiae]QWC65224.1 hypothetical protein JY395_12605 [Enterobacter mori]